MINQIKSLPRASFHAANRAKLRPKRHYQVVWETLKSQLSCEVKVDSRAVARVIKAVIKEKYMDNLYRAEMNKKFEEMTACINNKMGSWKVAVILFLLSVIGTLIAVIARFG